jgi:hypothetical protein
LEFIDKREILATNSLIDQELLEIIQRNFNS